MEASRKALAPEVAQFLGYAKRTHAHVNSPGASAGKEMNKKYKKKN